MSYEIPIKNASDVYVRTDVVGLFNHDNFARSLPETKAVISANFVSGPHAVAGYIRHVTDYRTTRALSDAAVAANAAGGHAKGLYSLDIDSFTTVDLQYSYSMESEDLTWTAGLKNAFDEDVPLVFDAANFSYDPKHHDPRGRMFTLGVKYALN